MWPVHPTRTTCCAEGAPGEGGDRRVGGASDFARSDGQAVSNEMLGNTILHTRELLDEAGVDWRKFTEEAGDETIAYSPLKLAIGRRGGVTNQGGLRAQQRLQADAAAARESEAEMAKLRKTIRDMAKHLPESERAPYLQAAKQTAKSGAQKGNGGEAQNLGLVAPAPQAGTQAAVATPVTPVVAEAIPTQAVVLATPQGKAGGAKLSWYAFPQFQAGNKVSLYDAAAGQKKGGGAAAKPKAKAKAAPKRGASVPPKSGSGGKSNGPDGRASSVGPKIPASEDFVKSWKLREVDWTAPVVYSYDEMVDSVQKLCASKDAGTLGQGVTHIFMMVQVEDEDGGGRVMAYQEARQEVLKLTTV